MYDSILGSMKHILITGSNGFIGGHLCRYLDEKGYRLRRCLRTLSLDMGENDVVIGEINGLTNWNTALEGIDTVIHLAGKAHSINNKHNLALGFRTVNFEGTQKLASESASCGVSRFIFLSSIAVYRSGLTQITDLTKPYPETSYGYYKLQAEIAIQRICETSEMDYVILRPPLVYGSGAPGNILKLNKLISLGLPLPFASIKNKRSFISIKNLSSIVHACMFSDEARNEVFLISDTYDRSTCDLMKHLADETGRRCIMFNFPENCLKFILKSVGLSNEFSKAFGTLVLDTKRMQKMLNWIPVEALKTSK